MNRAAQHFYEFGPFCLNPADGLLLRDGVYVPLAPKLFDTLLPLVENAGIVLGKEELIRKIWPDTFVEEVNLAKNVSCLRKVLGEEESKQYIQTVPKRGYRFVAKVREFWDQPSEVAIVSQISASPTLRIVPFTSFPGCATHPAFSPDANQIAFAWGGENGDNPGIYVKQIGPGQPIRLTAGTAADTHPAWSPDGRYIAFFRQSAERSAFYLVPSLGGHERRVADVFQYEYPTQGNSQYYSPDGKLLAAADKDSQDQPFAIYILSIETGEKLRVTSPPRGTVGDFYPGFSPDGKLLAFTRSACLATSDIYLLSLSGGEPRRLTFDNASILGLAWTSDGREIVFSSRRGSSVHSLWRIPVTGGMPERVLAVGQKALSPTVSRQGDRLAYTQILDDLNVWRLELDEAGRGRSAAPLISSTLDDEGADYSPDGRRIVFASDRTGDFGIWICNQDGTNPVRLVNRGSYLTGTPRWSPDGHWIAYDSRASDSDRAGSAHIYVVSADGGEPRRLTAELCENVTPSWSRDRKWIYYSSTRSGGMQVWKTPFEGGQAVQVTRHGGFEGFESTDGKVFYYAKGRYVPGIWQIPVSGGEETLVLDHHRAGYWRLWAVVREGIYFATANLPSRPLIEFFNFSTGKITQVAALDKPISRSEPGLSVAPDGRSLLFVQFDRSGSDIMLVEGFR